MLYKTKVPFDHQPYSKINSYPTTGIHHYEFCEFKYKRNEVARHGGACQLASQGAEVGGSCEPRNQEFVTTQAT